MISVCIPIYNFCVVPLAQTLKAQADGVQQEVELVFIDDCSSGEYKEKNTPLIDLGRYIQLAQNIGRARIRNLFLQHARGDYLLYLDNDSIAPEGFLSRYADMLPQSPSVVVGGRIYDRQSDSPQCHLRYLYGVEAECRTAAQRSNAPYRSFMTNNFMVNRHVMERVQFDERLSLYGHEDTLFGYRLQQLGIPIVHIDNPVVNGEVESNDLFLSKTEEAIQNLLEIYRFMAGDDRFCRSVKLLDTWRKVKQMGAEGAVYLAFRIMRSPLKSHFIEGNAISIKQFNFYKLGLFIEKRRNNNLIHKPNND